MPREKRSFIKNARLLFTAREKTFYNFETKNFQFKYLKSEPAVFDIPKQTKLTNFCKKNYTR